jgi:hypothetical protein
MSENIEMETIFRDTSHRVGCFESLIRRFLEETGNRCFKQVVNTSKADSDFVMAYGQCSKF